MATIPEVLLQHMEDRKVIPIEGQCLSMADADGRRQNVDQLLAEDLALQTTTSPERLPQSFSPDNVACSYPDFHSDPSSVDTLVKSREMPSIVIPAKAGIQLFQIGRSHLDSGACPGPVEDPDKGMCPGFTAVTTSDEFVSVDTMLNRLHPTVSIVRPCIAREVIGRDGRFELREAPAPYKGVLGLKNPVLRPQHEYFGEDTSCIST